MQINENYLKNHFAIIVIGLILVMGICIPICHAEETKEQIHPFSPGLSVSETATNYSTPQVIHEGYYPNEWVMTSSGSDLNITQFESDANQMVKDFREKYNSEIHRALWVKPTFNATQNNSVVGAGIIIHPDGVVNQIELYNSDPDTANQDAMATKLDQWKIQEYSKIKEKLNSQSSVDGDAPVALGYKNGITTSKPWGETSFTSNYYYDFTSSKTIGYFYVDSTVIITPGKVKKDQGKEGFTEATRNLQYLVEHDWTAADGSYNPIPGAALMAHNPVTMSTPTTTDLELGYPPSLKLTLHINFPGETVSDQTSGTIPAWKHDFNDGNDVALKSYTSDYGSEIETYYSNLQCQTTYALATVKVSHKLGFCKPFHSDCGPKTDAFDKKALDVTYTC